VCERILKKAILHRKNALFYRTLNGAHVGDVFMSLIHTAELNQIAPFEYLVALQRNAAAVAARTPPIGCRGTTRLRSRNVTPVPTRPRRLIRASNHRVKHACRRDTLIGAAGDLSSCSAVWIKRRSKRLSDRTALANSWPTQSTACVPASMMARTRGLRLALCSARRLTLCIACCDKDETTKRDALCPAFSMRRSTLSRKA
jgi:hypothetical protein